jgi:hypothetical protein
MPTFDGGHYFLTVLVPIRTAPMKDDAAATSPVHALRKRLSVLPCAVGTPGVGGAPSPFTRSARTHFARFVIIDDVAYNGRDGRNVALVTLAGEDLTVAQPQDHLTCPLPALLRGLRRPDRRQQGARFLSRRVVERHGSRPAPDFQVLRRLRFRGERCRVVRGVYRCLSDRNDDVVQ